MTSKITHYLNYLTHPVFRIPYKAYGLYSTAKGLLSNYKLLRISDEQIIKLTLPLLKNLYEESIRGYSKPTDQETLETINHALEGCNLGNRKVTILVDKKAEKGSWSGLTRDFQTAAIVVPQEDFKEIKANKSMSPEHLFALRHESYHITQNHSLKRAIERLRWDWKLDTIYNAVSLPMLLYSDNPVFQHTQLKFAKFGLKNIQKGHDSYSIQQEYECDSFAATDPTAAKGGIIWAQSKMKATPKWKLLLHRVVNFTHPPYRKRLDKLQNFMKLHNQKLDLLIVPSDQNTALHQTLSSLSQKANKDSSNIS